MIVVKFQKEGINISGHAGYASCGKDIVCAGISALTYNLINSMNALTKDHVECKHDDTKDETQIRFKNLSKEGNLLVDSFFLGILSIQEEYPDYVKTKAQNMKA